MLSIGLYYYYMYTLVSFFFFTWENARRQVLGQKSKGRCPDSDDGHLRRRRILLQRLTINNNNYKL